MINSTILVPRTTQYFISSPCLRTSQSQSTRFDSRLQSPIYIQDHRGRPKFISVPIVTKSYLSYTNRHSHHPGSFALLSILLETARLTHLSNICLTSLHSQSILPLLFFCSIHGMEFMLLSSYEIYWSFFPSSDCFCY